MTEELEIAGPPITELSKMQRRVLGTLLEKAFTTPEYYPLTLKALTTGCNQKNNRNPLTNYTEDDVLPIIDELRELGLVAVVHTETGRTERYRHYMRKRFQFSEQQLAILTELLLRGKQSVGDLRSRASRMVPIDSLDDLRDALRGLKEHNAVQSTGPLERRGVEVDHNFYLPREGNTLNYDDSAEEDEPPSENSSTIVTRRAAINAVESQSSDTSRLEAAESALARLQSENSELRQTIESLQQELQEMSDRLSRLERELGL